MNKIVSLSLAAVLRPLLRRFLPVLAAGAACFLAGCNSADPDPRFRAYIFYETNIASAGAPTIALKMPLTPKEPFTVIANPQIADMFFTEVLPVEVGPPGARFPCLAVRLNERATRKLAGDSMALVGKHIFLVVNGDPVGMHRVTGQINSGDIFFHMQLGDNPADLPSKIIALSKDLNESIVILRKKMEKQ
jgi:hypothetical protein